MANFLPSCLQMNNKEALTLCFCLLNCWNIWSSSVNQHAKVEWSVSTLADTIHLPVPFVLSFKCEKGVLKIEQTFEIVWHSRIHSHCKVTKS